MLVELVYETYLLVVCIKYLSILTTMLTSSPVLQCLNYHTSTLFDYSFWVWKYICIYTYAYICETHTHQKHTHIYCNNTRKYMYACMPIIDYMHYVYFHLILSYLWQYLNYMFSYQIGFSFAVLKILLYFIFFSNFLHFFY